jgi:sulfoxide reductase catalytic subunit YedY
MWIKRPAAIPYSAVSPKRVYLNRRRFLASLPLAGPALFAGRAAGSVKLSAGKSKYSTDETPTPFQVIASYNNYY